jgi:hypothetical protein
MIELRNFILKILQISNDYYEPDLDFIKLKYQLDNIKDFNSLYVKNSNELLIFNSNHAEKLFIRLLNLDENFINRKYNKDINSIITDFIVNKNNNYFLSICDEFYNLNKSSQNNTNNFIYQTKSHIKNCNCKIRVKSIVNLSINTLIKIIKNTINNKKNLLDDNVKNLKKKIKNSKNNMDMVDCIKILNTIKSNIGLECIDVDNDYIFETSTLVDSLKGSSTLVDALKGSSISENNSIENYKEKNNYNLKNQFDDTDKISINQISKNQISKNNDDVFIKNKNFQIDTEYCIEDIKEIDTLIKKKIKKNNVSYSLLSSNIISENHIIHDKNNKVNSDNDIKINSDNDKNNIKINSDNDKNNIKINSDNDKNNIKINSDNDENDIKINSDNDENDIKINSDNEEILFKLDELKDYFNSINENNIGQLLYGFEILYKIKYNIKNNKIIIDMINIILDKNYKDITFSRNNFLYDIDNLIKLLSY